MYGKVPGVKAPSWIGRLHRWSGRTAFLLTIPVAVHCLYALELWLSSSFWFFTTFGVKL